MWLILEKGTSRRFLHKPDVLLFSKYLLTCPTMYGSTGEFTNYRSSHSEVLEKLFWKIWKNSQENIHGGVFFLIFANKNFTIDRFLVIFSNLSDQLFQRTPLDDCFWDYLGKLLWRFLRYRSHRSEVLDSCSEKFEKIPRGTYVEVYFFKFS